MKISKNLKLQIRDYIAITIGAFIMALGIGAFLTDAQVVPGGVSGLAMVVHYISAKRIPVGLTMWIFNVPLYLWGLKEIGKQFGVRTFVGFSLSSLFIDLLRGNIPGFKFIKLQESTAIRDLYQNDFILAVIIGAVLLGIGLGIIFKFRGSTGGSDIVAAIMQKKSGWKPGQAFLLIDSLVITTAGLVIYFMKISTFKPALTLTLYAFILLFISSKLIDILIEGMDYAKAATIISPKYKEIADAIMDDLSRGATALKGRGLYTDQDREVIYTVVSRKEITLLTDTIKMIDPNAFVIINNVHEVLGHGFRRRV